MTRGRLSENLFYLFEVVLVLLLRSPRLLHLLGHLLLPELEDFNLRFLVLEIFLTDLLARRDVRLPFKLSHVPVLTDLAAQGVP